MDFVNSGASAIVKGGSWLFKAAVIVAAAVAGASSGSSASDYELNTPLNTEKPVVYRMPYQGDESAIPAELLQGAIPSNARAIPSNVKAIPSNVKAIPSNAKAIPSNAKAIPSNAKALPAEGIPLAIDPERAQAASAIPSNLFKRMSHAPNLSGPELGDIGSYICSEKWCDPDTNYYTFGGAVLDVNGNLLYASGSVWADAPPAPAPVTSDDPVAPPEPAPAQTADRCDQFAGKDLDYVALDWQAGSPLSLYFKVPGGVPGLEKKVNGDSGSWEYTVDVDGYTGDCQFIQGYAERLYCSVDLPSGYASSNRPMQLQVNGCSTPLYNVSTADIPAYSGGGSTSGGGGEGSGGGSSSGGGGAGQEVGGPSCGSEPSNTDHSAYQSWCSCNGGSYSKFACESPGCPISTCSLP